jgi:hypothetical protein
MLRMVAHTLELAVWRTDHVGRGSDDQFLVILKGCSGDSLRAVGDRIGRMLASDGMEWWGNSDLSPSPFEMPLPGPATRPNPCSSVRGRRCKPSRIKKPIPQNPLRARRPGARQRFAILCVVAVFGAAN